jgi:lysozyme
MVSGSNVVIDISHYNGQIDFAKIKAAGIIGVIQKASQGQAGIDFTYSTNKAKAKVEGLLWGAYHFATGGDGVEQAEHFLEVVGEPTDTLLALDFEANPTGPSMNLNEAHAFVTHIETKTGRFPGLYSGHYIKELLGSNSDPILAQCWFWLAQYGPTPVVPSNWPTWTLWQYTDGNFGLPPHEIPGIAGIFDRDTFNGSLDNLRKLWGVG